MSTGADTHDLPTNEPADAEPLLDRAGRGEVVRLLPIAVLVISADRYFRAAATMLLSRRGCSVLSAGDQGEALAQVGLHAVDVLVVELTPPPEDHLRQAHALARLIDAAAVAAGRRVASVGVVVVAEGEELGETPGAEARTTHATLDKWGPFERLYQAVSDRDRARRIPAQSGHPAQEALRPPGAV